MNTFGSHIVRFCFGLIIPTIFGVSAFADGAVKLGPLIKDIDSLESAFRACASKGARVPTILELIMTINPSGLTEERIPRQTWSRAGWNTTADLRPGEEVNFIYKRMLKTNEDFANFEQDDRLWSSTLNSRGALLGPAGAYTLGLNTKELDDERGNSVRCVVAD